MNKRGAALNFTRDNLSRTKEYRAWAGMIHRCYHKSYYLFHRYGGRGISVCERWRSDFNAFVDDLGHPPSERHSLDRINNDGNYEPNNCRWATIFEQSINRSNNFIIEFMGERRALVEWAKIYNKPYTLLIKRIKRSGLSLEEAISRPINLKQQANSLKRKKIRESSP